MKKSPQPDIEALLAGVPEAEFLGFAKEYFGSHSEMKAAFRKRFPLAVTSDAAEFDCKKEVAKCYKHRMKQVRWERDWSYQPVYLDWEAVGRDLRRLVSRVETFAAEKPELALETAFGIIEMNSVQYEEEFLGEREDWDEEDFRTGECIELIRRAFRSPELTAEQILAACDRLERLQTSPVFREADYGCEDLLYETRRGLVSDDEFLAILKRSFQNAESWQKEGAACEIWDFLVEAGREQEAVAFFGEHKEMEELRGRYVEMLLTRKAYNEALDVADEGVGIARKMDYRGNVCKWLRMKLEIFEAMGDRTSEIAVMFELMKDSWAEEIMEYYHRLKKMVAQDEWDACREKIFDILQEKYGDSADSDLTEIYVEEGLLDRLYQHLMSADRCLFDGVERYAKLFDKLRQGSLVSRLERSLKSGLGYNPTRKTYKDLAARLKRLSKICSAGRRLATDVKEYYLATYPNRPALREELGSVKW